MLFFGASGIMDCGKKERPKGKREEGRIRMEYRRFGDKIIGRVDRGEEIVEQLRVIAEKEKISLASVEGLGALNRLTVGVFKTDEKVFSKNEFTGYYEVVSLTGTINTMDGAFYTHLHMSAGDETGRVIGGHLSEAFVSATAELVITVIDGRVDRAFDEETGLNLFRFD